MEGTVLRREGQSLKDRKCQSKGPVPLGRHLRDRPVAKSWRAARYRAQLHTPPRHSMRPSSATHTLPGFVNGVQMTAKWDRLLTHRNRPLAPLVQGALCCKHVHGGICALHRSCLAHWVPPVIFVAQDPSTEVSCVSLPPPPHRISFITIYILSLNTPKPVASMWQCIPYSNSKFCHSSEKYYPILLTLLQFLSFIWNRDIDMCLWYNSTPTYKACIAAGRN